MGISGLSYLLQDATPDAITSEKLLSAYSGKIIAMDASQYLYQSMSPRRLRRHQQVSQEETSSPILRTFYSIIRLLRNGIKPLYVFDGRAPSLKSGVIKERAEKREEAMIEFKKAEVKGEVIKMQILKRQTVKVGKPEVKTCKGLLRLMGIPYFYAPGEAEAQCAALLEAGRVFAVATQDMDALLYGTKVVLRHLPIYHDSKLPIQELRLEKVLNSLQLNLPEFIDLSILLGCDYCTGIKGLSAHRALEFIHRYKSIEGLVDNIDRTNLVVPNNWLYKEAREVFLNPRIKECQFIEEFSWKSPQKEEVLNYLANERNFDAPTVRKGFDSIQDTIT